MKSDTDPPPTRQANSSTTEPIWSSRLSRIRHDLRNPLSEILGFSEILQEEAAERGLQQLADAFARSKRQAPGDPSPLASGEALTETIFIRELESDPGAASGALLIVDDDEANRALLARRLRRQGFTVSLAENGRQALEKLRARRFDLVLLDVIMPEMGGYHVLEKMKLDAELRHIPVIMISALDDLEMLD